MRNISNCIKIAAEICTDRCIECCTHIVMTAFDVMLCIWARADLCDLAFKSVCATCCAPRRCSTHVKELVVTVIKHYITFCKVNVPESLSVTVTVTHCQQPLHAILCANNGCMSAQSRRLLPAKAIQLAALDNVSHIDASQQLCSLRFL